MSVTVRVPMNIALVKYWGKRDEKLILPLNDSISLTVDELCAETSVELVKQDDHTVSINGKEVDLESNKRYRTVFNEALRFQRKRAHEKENGTSNNNIGLKFKVTSTTNFPVAAGLASSAAGFAAISMAIQILIGLDETQANKVARIGSGSACRSMFGGLVQWKSGIKDDGTDCFAIKVNEGWNTLRCLIFVFDGEEKKVGSTEGMRRSSQTSDLLKYRIEHLVDKRIAKIAEAYEKRDFDEFAKVIMSDSNQFHAICLDTSPPIRYLSDASWKLIEVVEKFNENGKRKAAYTFDAGPNACVILEDQNVQDFLRFATSQIVVPIDDLNKISTSITQTEQPIAVAKKLIYSSMGSPPTQL
ncbi:unnamed protein product [Caenorhabditis angaria]|uniref:Diphosphomevalonate decarboxylase n=1 Tax=Caenorhabditis angaria TaxID=860376 RepID=A0A9P1ICM2_9PELO|nr:unnamed protein product [Caenorhabditis angaria]